MKRIILLLMCAALAACTLNEVDLGSESGSGGGVTARVTRVIDGDTIDVEISGQTYRVRYVGVNTPERDEECYAEAVAANAALVEGRTVRLEFDTSDTDRFDRLLRYV